MKIGLPGWLLLIASLPTAEATHRMRLWRAINSLGCVPLRDGAYLLPDIHDHAALLAELADKTNQENGQAWVLTVVPRSSDDDVAFRSLFDRAVAFAEIVGELGKVQKGLAAQSSSEIARTIKRLRKEIEAVQRIDFFPGDASLAAQSSWSDFYERANAVLSPDEPRPAERTIEQLSRENYQTRIWATRRNLWVDRVASAWLIDRFVDRKATFVWLNAPADCPPDALGFDFNGAAFTHIDDKVTIEVLIASFGLGADPALARIAALVHFLDVGGPTVPEAPGFEAILSGARSRLPDDDALLAEISGVLDSLHSYYKKEVSV